MPQTTAPKLITQWYRSSMAFCLRYNQLGFKFNLFVNSQQFHQHLWKDVVFTQKFPTITLLLLSSSLYFRIFLSMWNSRTKICKCCVSTFLIIYPIDSLEHLSGCLCKKPMRRTWQVAKYVSHPIAWLYLLTSEMADIFIHTSLFIHDSNYNGWNYWWQPINHAILPLLQICILAHPMKCIWKCTLKIHQQHTKST